MHKLQFQRHPHSTHSDSQAESITTPCFVWRNSSNLNNLHSVLSLTDVQRLLQNCGIPIVNGDVFAFQSSANV